MGSFGLQGKVALRTVEQLSGGQKTRLVLSILFLKRPHVLILDEPTNHLDYATINALVEALKQFEGAAFYGQLAEHEEHGVRKAAQPRTPVAL